MKFDVKKINELHDQAILLADQAFDRERKGNPAEAKRHFYRAFDLERQAAMFLVNDFDQEPSRSVLFRSAACLAIKAGQFREAEKMVSFGLSGNPPHPIDKELREALYQALAHTQPLEAA